MEPDHHGPVLRSYLVEYRAIGVQVVEVDARSKADAIRKVLDGQGYDVSFEAVRRYPSTARAYVDGT